MSEEKETVEEGVEGVEEGVEGVEEGVEGVEEGVEGVDEESVRCKSSTALESSFSGNTCMHLHTV